MVACAPQFGDPYTPTGPPLVELIPALRDRYIRVGERFPLGYQVKSVGKSAVPAGAVVSVNAGDLRVVGPGRARLGRIPPGEIARGSFTLVGDREGTSPLSLQVASWGGDQAVDLAATVKGTKQIEADTAPSDNKLRRLVSLGLFGLAAGAIIAGTVFRRRRVSGRR